MGVKIVKIFFHKKNRTNVYRYKELPLEEIYYLCSDGRLRPIKKGRLL